MRYKSANSILLIAEKDDEFIKFLKENAKDILDDLELRLKNN